MYAMVVCLIMVKVLWGFWARDLTFGDTSSYFKDAVRWHQDGQINIVWSPLYTAYFGSWLSITENANVATLLHRVGLIVFSTGLVAWLGYITLPRVLALLLVVWWVALPIHYDTLYEVHLFGALPILVMALVSIIVNDKWKLPLLISIALITTFLIRNEFVLVIGALIVLGATKHLFKKNSISLPEIKFSILRYSLLLLISGLFIVYFYSISYVKGSEISNYSAPKHTLNMCQVYAFGYQQRQTDWLGSPWTDCSSLMQQKFGVAMPTLYEMVTANPTEVITHFFWNFSLTRAGLEVLLFNSTSGLNNPDYAPVLITPVYPTLLLMVSIGVITLGTIILNHKTNLNNEDVKQKIALMTPLLLAVLVMSLAVIITQRPRPSYLLGAGMLYTWLMLQFLITCLPVIKKLDNLLVFISFVFLLLFFIPSYSSLPLSSKNGTLGAIYNELKPHAKELCQPKGKLALNEYGVNLVSYQCSHLSPNPIIGGKGILDISSLPEITKHTKYDFISALEKLGASALIIDPYMLQKFPNLGSCSDLSNALTHRGWNQLTYSLSDDGQCIAAFKK